MSEHTMLYRFFDENDTLLYIGISSRGPHRWKEHSRNRPWWHEVTRSTIEHYATRCEAADAETKAITREKPIYNVVHNTRLTKTRTGGLPPVVDDGVNIVEWRKEQRARIRQLQKTRYFVEPVVWRGIRIDSDFYEYRRYRNKGTPTLLLNRHSGWTYVSLDYHSMNSFSGYEFGDVSAQWGRLRTYFTTGPCYYSLRFTGSTCPSMEVPTCFEDLFIKAFLMADVGIEHHLVTTLRSAISGFTSDVELADAHESRRVGRWLQDRALYWFPIAHEIVASEVNQTSHSRLGVSA